MKFIVTVGQKRLWFSVTIWWPLVSSMQLFPEFLLVRMIWLFLLQRKILLKNHVRRLTNTNNNTLKDLSPRVKSTTRLLMLGHNVLTKWRQPWWRKFRQRSLVSLWTLSLWWLTLVPVVPLLKWSSWLVCVVWWQSLMVKSLKRLLSLTLKKVCRFLNTLTQPTERVRDFPIQLWKRRTRVTWHVVWLTLHKML